MVMKGESGRSWRVSKAQHRRDFGGGHRELLEIAHGKSNRSHSSEKTAPERWAAQTRRRGQEATGGLEVCSVEKPRADCKSRSRLCAFPKAGQSLKHLYSAGGSLGTPSWTSPQESRTRGLAHEHRPWGLL